MKRRTSQSRRGMVLLPLILMLLVVTFLLGWMVIREASRSALVAQANAAAESAAVEVLTALQSPEYADSASAGIGVALERGQLAAMANGMDPRFFAPLGADDVRIGSTWVEVTLRPRGRDGVMGRALAYGAPAGRMSAGAVRRTASGQAVPSGCLPLGVQLMALPVDGADDGQGFWVAVGGDAASAQPLRLAGGDPIQHVRFLSGGVSGEPAGTPPPAVEVGDSVEIDEHAPAFLAELNAGLAGRTVIVPLLDGTRVVGFGRLRVDEVNADGGAMRVTLAPSAVVPSAGPSSRWADLGITRSDDQPVAAYGVAMVVQTRS